MLRLLVWISILGIVGFLVLAVIAPATPDGSWLHELGEDVLDSMSAWWGNPVTID